ncbi:hypothetical protein BJ875DRAFT_381259, partial [Amylocarpus encephaloides]
VNMDGMGPPGDRGRGWQGNVRAYHTNENHGHGKVLAEVVFRGDRGQTFFDVSAIKTSPNNNDGIDWMFPNRDHDHTKLCGCNSFPCGNVYITVADNNKPGLTKSTWDNEIIVEIRLTTHSISI